LLNKVFQDECVGRMSRMAGVIEGRAIRTLATGEECDRVDAEGDAPSGAAALIVSFVVRTWPAEPVTASPKLMPVMAATPAIASAMRQPRKVTPLIPIR